MTKACFSSFLQNKKMHPKPKNPHKITFDYASEDEDEEVMEEVEEEEEGGEHSQTELEDSEGGIGGPKHVVVDDDDEEEEKLTKEKEGYDVEGWYIGGGSYANGEEDTNSCETDASSNRFISVRLSDPNVFDCSICSQLLTIPVFQCGNGHAVCSTCFNDLRKKCRMCSLPIGNNRCVAIERVLESIQVPCPNVKYGCKEILSYSEKNDHDRNCAYVPCLCPYIGCHFAAPSHELSFHFSHKHGDYALPFLYDEFFTVPLTCDGETIVLQEESDSILFILRNAVVESPGCANVVEPMGCGVYISCFGPNSSPRGYYYSMRVRSQGWNTLIFYGVTKNIQRCTGTTPSRFLMIPYEDFGSSGSIELEICIRDIYDDM